MTDEGVVEDNFALCILRGSSIDWTGLPVGSTFWPLFTLFLIILDIKKFYKS